ncbi:MAG TPA: DUF488 family protein [Gemmatimonadaceae bacterium]|jgi:uncharacterized protein YeaO (DUF488 family)|nr:DUF488 family protein [Gemmatimonadaceae bacterium]
MSLHVVRLGSPRLPGEGLRLGTVRRPPRGVRKEDYASRDYYDVWLPELAPSGDLVSWALSEPFTDKRWKKYEKAYRAQMRRPAAARLIALLAAMSRRADLAIGCYCENPAKCHRSILADLLVGAGANLATEPE